MPVTVIVCASGIICALIVLSTMRKSGRFPASLFLSALEGTAALFAVNAAGTFTGVALSVNWLTIFSGAVFGVPGVAAHLILQLFVR